MLHTVNKAEFSGGIDLAKTFGSEQCPTDIWQQGNGQYRTWVESKGNLVPVAIWENDTTIFIESDLPWETILSCFWLEQNLQGFYGAFTSDSYLSSVIEAGRGLRVMKDFDLRWRLIEAILTQNASVKQTRTMGRLMRAHFGNGHTVDFSKVCAATERELQGTCRVGYRARYVKAIAEAVMNGELDLEALHSLSGEKARAILTAYEGIGPKVADIILLYGYGKPDAFPMDVWIRRALIREYFKGKSQSDKTLREFGFTYFGRHVGIAHLYIFYYERKVRIKQEISVNTI